MQDGCTISGENCYFSCRKAAAKGNEALNSRAGAAEELNVSESSLKNYEMGVTPVPVDVVVRMAETYGAPELKTRYCKRECPIGRDNSRNIADEIKGISEITISLLCHLEEEKAKESIKSLLRIAKDGKITDEEREELRNVVETMENATRDVSDLRLLMEKRCGANGTR